jgi:uncharacterized protein YutE (UPF0331/DUF86 family)
MINVQVIQERLAKLSEYVELLRKYQTLTYEQFSQDVEAELVVERILQLATQAVIDIATHIVATTSNKRPQDYEEAIELLGDVGVLPAVFAKSIKPMAGFRNILVHGYIEIDESKVYDNMQRGFADFQSFAEYIYRWLDKQGLSHPPNAKS